MTARLTIFPQAPLTGDLGGPLFARRKSVKRLLTNMLRTGILLGGILLALPFPAWTQDIGVVGIRTAQQKIFSGQTTATTSPNSSTFPCTPSNGSPCGIPNQSQSVHQLLYMAPSCTGIDIRLEGSFDGVNFFAISQDATDNAPNPIGGVTGSGGIIAIGYYPVVRANLLSVVGASCSVTAFYSGSATSGPPSTQVNQQASLYRSPITINTVTSNAFTTIEIPTPFGNSLGSIWLQCSAACAASGAVTVFAAPSDTTPIGSVQIMGQAVGTVSTLQRFDVPAFSTNRVFVSLTPTAASANTWTIFYNFTAPGLAPGFANSLFGNSLGPVSCNNFTPINTAASVQLLSGLANKKFFICSFQFVNSIADNIALVEGTGATCGTGTAGLFGGATAATGWNLGANGQVSMGTGLGEIGQTAAAGDSLCLLVSSAAQVSGGFTWTQF
jgi:hypothetical protein